MVMDKEIQVLGKGTPLIIIDGRVASVDELDQLNPAQIKNIELINTPSALYNADSVLKITTKQRFSAPFFVKTQVEGNKTFRGKGSFYNANVDVNYQHKKTNYGLNFNYKPIFSFNKDILCYTTQEGLLVTDSISAYVENPHNYNLSLNVFHEFDRKNNLYYQAQQNFYASTKQSDAFLLETSAWQTNAMKSQNFLHSSYLIFTHVVDSLGQSFRWMNHYSVKTSDEQQNIFKPLGEDKKYFYNALAQTFSTEPVYIFPFLGHELSSGVKYQLAFSDLDFTGETRNNTEHIFSAYTQLAMNFKTLQLQAGLRYEGSALNIAEENSTLLQKKNHLFLPNISLKYTFQKQFQTQFSYAFRVVRPTMSQLSPNVNYTGVISSYSTALDLSSVYRHNFDYQIFYKQLVGLKINYAYEEKPYFLNIISDDEGNFPSFFDNLDKAHHLTLSAVLQYQKGFWQTNNSVAYVYRQKTGLGTLWQSHGAQLASSHFLKMPNNFQFELSLKYFSTTLHQFGLMLMPHIFEMYGALRKSFFKDNLQIYCGALARFHREGFYYFDMNLPEVRREKWEFRDNIEYVRAGLIFKLKEQNKNSKKIIDIEDLQRL